MFKSPNTSLNECHKETKSENENRSLENFEIFMNEVVEEAKKIYRANISSIETKKIRVNFLMKNF